jgi:hypothetical protein
MTKIFNNIFYTRHQIFNITIETSCLTGFECDYNLYWCEDGEPIFMVGDKELTFTQWRELGYDLHSRVINPKFINAKDFVPESRLDYGKNLGNLWGKGLSVNAEWGTVDPETTSQNGSWQVGARIYSGTQGKSY